MSGEIFGIPEPDFPMRRKIARNEKGNGYVIFVNENDVAQFDLEQLEKSIEYMHLVCDAFKSAGHAVEVITRKW